MLSPHLQYILEEIRIQVAVKILVPKVWKRFPTFLCSEAATRGVLWKKTFLENSQENTCASDSFLIKLQALDLAYNFIKKESLAQVFSYKLREISKNTFFIEHFWTTASIC